jgi:hypothetical protein
MVVVGHLVHFQMDQKSVEVDSGQSLCCQKAGQGDRDWHLQNADSDALPLVANELADRNAHGLLRPTLD